MKEICNQAIYHIPLAPCTGEEGVYRVTQEYYEADAETLRGYVASLLQELNETRSGIWRPVKPGEIKVYGEIPGQHYVLRGDYPDEPPVMVAFISRDRSMKHGSE